MVMSGIRCRCSQHGKTATAKEMIFHIFQILLEKKKFGGSQRNIYILKRLLKIQSIFLQYSICVSAKQNKEWTPSFLRQSVGKAALLKRLCLISVSEKSFLTPYLCLSEISSLGWQLDILAVVHLVGKPEEDLSFCR